jgi:hypothetical protein
MNDTTCIPHIVVIHCCNGGLGTSSGRTPSSVIIFKVIQLNCALIRKKRAGRDWGLGGRQSGRTVSLVTTARYVGCHPTYLPTLGVINPQVLAAAAGFAGSAGHQVMS